jgi:glycosyltransferase involved in cell wall biosynthesis
VRVVFDAYWWVAGPPSLRHVLREIVFAWRRDYPGDELCLVVRRKHAAQARAELPDAIAIRESALWPQALLAVRSVSHAAKAFNADAVLTHNFAPRSGSVSTIYLHDVLFETNPEWFTPAERAYFSFMTRLAPHADVVFTSSESEADRIRAHTTASRVLPVGLGLSSELTGGEELEPVAGLVPGSFLLTVGRLNVRKNLRRTIAAALEARTVGPALPLVVVGASDGKAEADDPALADAVRAGSVVFTGHVSEAQLRWLYRSTRLFLFLSLGEGFGMPPVEALYFGAPVIASDLPVFHENLADSARYVDPLDVPAITAAIEAELAPGGTADRAVRPEVAAAHDWGAAVGRMRAAIAETVGAR